MPVTKKQLLRLFHLVSELKSNNYNYSLDFSNIDTNALAQFGTTLLNNQQFY